jgi:hypothetical protein
MTTTQFKDRVAFGIRSKWLFTEFPERESRAVAISTQSFELLKCVRFVSRLCFSCLRSPIVLPLTLVP